MERAVVIINEAPSSMRAWNGFRLSGALIGADMKVEVFLLNDGVFCAQKGQTPPDEISGQNTASKIKELLGLGARIRLCTQCAQTRGISEAMAVEGMDWVSMVDLAKSIRESNKVVSF
ncbi:MAG: DsrE family protein [Candidatus Dadabacteria bacterium]|nr:DsrE family protein [Candidatus Dadabacteria bacterium]